MKRFKWVVGIVLGFAAVAAAQSLPAIQLKVGVPTPFTPGYHTIQIVCDDPSIVNVSDGKTSLLLTGLKVGTTQCGFWRDAGMRNVYQVIVTKK